MLSRRSFRRSWLRHNLGPYRDNARKLQKAIGEANGLSVTADLIEESLGVRKKASSKLLFLMFPKHFRVGLNA